MSIGFKTYFCDKCDYRSSNLDMYGLFVYKTEQSEISINRRLGWCNCCQKLSPVEDFEDIAYTVKRMKEDLESVKKYKGFWYSLLAVFVRPFHRGRESIMESLSDGVEWLRISTERKGQERCLTCGSKDVKAFNGDDLLQPEVWPGSYEGEKNTGFEHPGCGGYIHVKGSDFRVMLRGRKKVYDNKGSFIEELEYEHKT